MTIPYSFRLLARIGTDQPIELMRSRRRYYRSYFQSFRRDMDRGWTIWLEVPLTDRHTITTRVRIRRV